jgi:hypothetical protein
MKSMILAAGSAALLAATAPVMADDHDDYLLDILRIEVKIGHDMKFREGVKAYMDCYAKAGGESRWSTWAGMDGDGIVYHVVSRMDGWAELDEKDEAEMKCWPVIGEQVAPHMASINTTYAKRLPDWSAKESDDDKTTVVRLHNFKVDDRRKFRAAIGTVTGIMEATKYEHMGTWYAVQGGGRDVADYFVVESYNNFTAMDDDRAGPYKTLSEHAGEDSAELVWDQYLDSLEEEDGYWSELMRYDEGLSHDN